MIELNFSPFPTIQTERLILRQLAITDIDVLFEIRSNAEAMKYIDKPLAKTKEDVIALYNAMQENLEKNTGIMWVIQYKENPTMLGYIGFWRIDTTNHRGEIGYTLLPQHFRKGIGSEAIAAALQHSFTKLNFHSVMADTNPKNKASQNILEKHGFIREAYFRENYNFNGVFLDSAVYGLLGSDWGNGQKSDCVYTV